MYLFIYMSNKICSKLKVFSYKGKVYKNQIKSLLQMKGAQKYSCKKREKHTHRSEDLEEEEVEEEENFY